MRIPVFVAILAFLLVTASGTFVETVGATPPKLFVTVYATSDNGSGANVFEPDRIVVPEKGTILNVTVVNWDRDIFHTFTIRDTANDLVVNVDLPGNGTGSVEFTVVDTRKISVNGTEYSVEGLGGGIKFFCVPHEAAGMIGTIVIGGAATEAGPEMGTVLVRAYWIGLIGFGATILWIIISYFLIKSSSVHFRDHRSRNRREPL